jgi:hypothetical protein
VTSGAVVIIGAICAIAASTVGAALEVEFASRACSTSKVPADALAVGAVAKVVTASGPVGAAGTASIG